MPRMKVAAKRPRRERLPSPSSDEEAPPPEQRIDKCPILVAQSKGFDDESGPFTLPFEGGEEMDEDEDEPSPRPSSQRPSSSSSGFTFTEYHFNLFNGWIDSLTSTVESMQSLLYQVLASQQAVHAHLGTGFPPPPPPEI
ncbi:Uncharacterized protein Adt_30692 [Abeliophyllum distichum]|uniref:Uncharacterized protein n=1 Tax=Abeliophyllum distichum TaxID=126358 RepID=A0ABD1RDE7_9LAMI